MTNLVKKETIPLENGVSIQRFTECDDFLNQTFNTQLEWTDGHIKTITPEIATTLLASSIRDTSSYNREVHSLAQRMIEDKFKFGPQSNLIFNKSGQLYNGVNRLLAIIKSGLPQEFVVQGNAHEDTFYSIDYLNRRMANDLLTINGATNAVLKSSIVRNIICYERGVTSTYISNEEINDRYFEDETIEESTDYAVTMSSVKSAVLPASRTGLYHYILTKINKERGELFLKRLTLGVGLTLDSPIHWLRSEFMFDRFRNQYPSAKAVMYYMNCAWNNFSNPNSILPLKKYVSRTSVVPPLYGDKLWNSKTIHDKATPLVSPIQKVIKSGEIDSVLSLLYPDTHPSEFIKGKKCKVGPKEALALLKFNTNNRKISTLHVGNLAEAMLDQRWHPTRNNYIAILENGRLGNAQHQLNAIIKSETKQDFWIYSHVDNDLVKIFDEGSCINLSSVLKTKGYKCHYPLSAAVKAIIGYEGERRSTGNTYIYLNRIEQDPSIVASVEYIQSIRKNEGSLVRINIITLYHYLYKAIDPVKANQVINELIGNEELDKNSYVFKFRRFLNEQEERGVSIHFRSLYWYMQELWYHHGLPKQTFKQYITGASKLRELK